MTLRDPLPFPDIRRPVAALAADYPAGLEIEPHHHSWAQLVYASRGVMSVGAARGRWIVPPHRAVWIPAGIEHAIRMHGAVRMRTLYLAPRAAADLGSACRVIEVTALLRALILRAVDLPRDYDEAGPDGRIMRVVLDELAAAPAEPLHLTRPRERRLARVTEALLRDPGDPRPLDAWARVAGASPRTLARLFVRETGLGFRAWRQRARLLRALVELAQGRPVTGVALDLGYDSPSAFIAAFKRDFGATPARYIRDRTSDRDG